ncbi:MAG: DUF2313 domain-containing protein [Christensenellaceae bacterium]|nr:DUF2313 domain-containing protein [Christensenellaceae bacterium]
MSEKANNRPEIYKNDPYAEKICGGLYEQTRDCWADCEVFKNQLFATTATEEGYEAWEQAHGIHHGGFQAAGDRREAILEKLHSGGSFDRKTVDAIIKSIVDTEYSITESKNRVSIVFETALDSSILAKLNDALNTVRPLHIKVNLRSI